MNKSELFKIAHRITKGAVKNGGDYRVTFGASLRAVKLLKVGVLKAISNGTLKIVRTESGRIVFTAKDRIDFARNFRAKNDHVLFQISLSGDIVVKSSISTQKINEAYAIHDIKLALGYFIK